VHRSCDDTTAVDTKVDSELHRFGRLLRVADILTCSRAEASTTPCACARPRAKAQENPGDREEDGGY